MSHHDTEDGLMENNTRLS